MTDLLELAARCEQAEGPSYELDCAIWDAIYPGERQGRFDKLTAKGKPYHMRLGLADMDGYVKPLRAFTASIDAAVSLVPEGWAWMCGCTAGPLFFADLAPTDESEIEADGEIANASTPALAICAASLKARSPTGAP